MKEYYVKFRDSQNIYLIKNNQIVKLVKHVSKEVRKAIPSPFVSFNLVKSHTNLQVISKTKFNEILYGIK